MINILPKITPRLDDARAAFRRQLIRHEAVIGGRLFGPIPKGTTRQFFCLDPHTWIWHEEWTDKTGRHVMVTRYDVRHDVILKSQNGGPARPLSPSEFRNFAKTVDLYVEKADAEYERMLQAV